MTSRPCASVWLLLTTASLLVLTGCADTAAGTASASSVDATDATSGSTAESSAESRSAAESEAPDMPELVEDRALEGAMAAVHHWFDGLHHAQLTGDVSAIEEVSWGTCARCEDQMSRLADFGAQGCTAEVEDEPLGRIYFAEVYDGWKTVTVTIAYDEPTRQLQGEGCEGMVEGAEHELVLDLKYGGIDGHWKVEEVWAVDELRRLHEEEAQESG